MAGKIKRQSLSIGAKTLLSHITLAVVVIALASVISYTLSSQYIRQTRIRDLAAKAERIAEGSNEVPEGDIVPRRRTVRTFEELTDAKVFYLAEDNEIIRMSQYYDEPEHGEGEFHYGNKLDDLMKAAYNNKSDIRKKVAEIVTTYHPDVA